MKVKVLGIELKFANNMSIEEVYQELERNEGKLVNYSDKYVYYTDIINNYIVGIVLRFKKNKKSIATSTDENGDFLVNKLALEKDQDNTEVSLFVVHPHTLKGLFYDYSGSVSTTGMKFIWKKAHDKALKAKRKDLSKQYSRNGDLDKELARSKAESETHGYLSLQCLTTGTDLSNLLSKYETLTSLEYTSPRAMANSGTFTPSHNFIKRSKFEIYFDKVFDPKLIKSYISDKFPIKSKEDEILRIKGLAHSGDELNQIVGDNSTEYGSLEFDAYVDLLPSNLWKDYGDCLALGKLLYRIHKLDSFFGKQPENVSWKLASAKKCDKVIELEKLAKDNDD